MEKEKTLALLQKFVDPTRKNMCKPFSQELKIGKYLCATDAHIVVLIPETEENKIENPEGYSPPNINGILPELEPINLNFYYLKQLYDDVPIIERFITEECESCEGEGHFFHYDHYYDCKSCDESGKVETKMKEKIKDPMTILKFKNANIHVSRIGSIIEVYKAVGKTHFEFKIMHIKGSIIWFKLDEILIAIAGVPVDEDEKEKFTLINVEL